jgi:energy-coupling factor transport system substrate-specific component
VRRFENAAVVVVSALGILAFAFPFIVSAARFSTIADMGRTFDASILFGSVVAGALVIAVGEVARGPSAGNLSRSIALLGALVAIDATLRLVPSFLGASPIFALIVLVGYVYGSRFGFVMGASTLLLSAAITAGIGPWLPFQMLCAGWVGVAAGWLPHSDSPQLELVTVAAYGAIAGMAFGALMNLYSWPFAAPGSTVDAGLYWFPTLSLAESVKRYAMFYVTTSLAHDTTRAIANVVLIAVAGAPVLRLLRRFRSRTSWSTVGAG